MLLELTKIEHFKEHMQCLFIKSQFQEQADVLKKILNVCILAVQQMKDSQRFKIMLTVILKMGNFMNGGSRRGGAFGASSFCTQSATKPVHPVETNRLFWFCFVSLFFCYYYLVGVKLDVLNKIETAKSKSGKFTLVHYLVQQLKINDEDTLQLPKDLYAVSDAAKYTIGQLSGDFAVIRKGMKTGKSQNLQINETTPMSCSLFFHNFVHNFVHNLSVATEVEWAKKSEDAQCFVELMGPFAENAQATVTASETKLQQLKDTFEQLATEFGENAAKTEMDAFFKQINHFIDVFKGAIAKIEATGGGLLMPPSEEG